MEPAAVEVVKLQAERLSDGTAEKTAFDLAASYMQDKLVVRYRYDVRAHLTDEGGASRGSVAVSVLVTARKGGPADQNCVERFGATTGALIAHPYLREAVASSAQRIGFPGVLLPGLTSAPDESPATDLRWPMCGW